MKAKLQLNITKALALLLVTAPVFASEPNESGAGKVCGVLRSFEGETQIFDYTRTHLGDAAFGVKLHCGDWVSVEKGKATIEHTAGAAFLIGENSFFQVLDPQSGDNAEHAHIGLYRGEFMVQPAKAEIRVVTPNAVARVEKGGAFVVYSTSAEETQLVGLGAKSSLENRFFPERRMAADFAKVVTFTNPVERLVPDQARYVNARDLNERLAKLEIPAALRDSIEKAVKAGSKTKMPVTLAVTARPNSHPEVKVVATGEFASHDANYLGSDTPKPKPNRAPASAPRAKAASRKRVKSAEPNFALKREASDESEKKKLLQALSSMRPDEDDQ